MDIPNELESREVKTAWSPNYILLTLTLSLLTGVTGYGLKWIFERAPRKVIGLKQEYSTNLLNIDQRAKSGIIASFARKEAADKPLGAYYECSITVTNDGKEGLEDAEVTIDTQDPKLFLGDSPSISTTPKELASALKVNRINGTGSASKEQWILGLLNPSESVQLRFVALSSDLILNASFQATARKKDWETIRTGEDREVHNNGVLAKPLREFTGKEILMLLFFYLVLSFAFNIYTALFWQVSGMQRILQKLGRRFGKD